MTVSQKTLEYMAEQDKRRGWTRIRNTAAAVGIIALLGAGGYFAWGKAQEWRQLAAAEALVKQLSASAPPSEVFQKMRAAVDSGQVSENAMRQMGRAMMETRINKTIDEMEKMRAQWRGPTSRPAGEGGPRGDGNPPTEADRARRDQERQARMDATPPERKAKMAEFASAMNKRREERGLEPMRGPFGGGGGGRGPGEGRGPGR